MSRLKTWIGVTLHLYILLIIFELTRDMNMCNFTSIYSHMCSLSYETVNVIYNQDIAMLHHL